jgi:hypothetical protein
MLSSAVPHRRQKRQLGWVSVPQWMQLWISTPLNDTWE